MARRTARRVLALLLLGGLCGRIPPCHAQHPPQGTHTASTSASEESIAGLRRIPGLGADARTVPADVTIITAEDIRRLQASTIQEVLARAAGIMVADQQGFGLGSDGSVNMRGVVNSSRTNALVLLDGVRQNRFTGDEVHWQAIPVGAIERIEIIRGAGATLYGEGALAGVINIISKHAAARLLEGESGAEVGAFGWQRYSVGARGSTHPVSYGLNYDRRLVGGYREFSSSRNTTVDAHSAWDVAPWLRSAIHVRHSEDTTGFPGGINKNETEARRRQTNPNFHGLNDNELNSVSLDTVLGPWQGTSTLVNVFWNKWTQRSEDHPFDSNLFTLTPSRGLSLRTDSEWTGAWLHNLLVSGIELGDDKASTGDHSPFPGPISESNRHGYGLYLEETLTVRDRLSLVGGFRYDRSRFEEDITVFDINTFSNVNYVGTLRFEGKSPRLGLSYLIIPDALKVFANYARPFKAPNVDDFASRSPEFRGNAALKPQQADTYEVGWTLTRAPLELQGAWFYAKTGQDILTNPLAGNQNQNFDTRRTGLELTGQAHWTDRLMSYVTYTVMDAEFRKGQFAGNTIPLTPRHTFNAGIGMSPFDSCWVTLDWQLVNDFYRINDVTNTLGKADNYGVLNLTVSYDVPTPQGLRVRPTTHAYLKALNLTNEEYIGFQSSNGTNVTGRGEFPMPSTTIIGGLSVTF